MNETLSRLGFTLQQDFQSWLSHVADLDFHTALVDQSIEFDRLAQELVACEQISDSFFEMEAWLTSGFLPNESEAAVVSPEELFTPSPIDRPSLKRGERDRRQTPSSVSQKPQPTGQSDFNSVSLRQPSIIPPDIEAAIPDQVENWTTAEITEPAKTIFPTSQNPVKGLKDLAAFLQEERATQTDFSSPDHLEVDRDQVIWPLSSNSATNLNWQALKEDKAIAAAGNGPLNPPILGDFELGEIARLPQDWGLGGECLSTVTSRAGLPPSTNSIKSMSDLAAFLQEERSTQADFPTPTKTAALPQANPDPVSLEVDRDQVTWPLSSNSVTDLDWQTLKEDKTIVAAGAGPLNPPFLNVPSGYILGDFELGKIASHLNSSILEDFETSMARKSPSIGGLGGSSGGYIDLDALLEALQQEINQDYYRFYGG